MKKLIKNDTEVKNNIETKNFIYKFFLRNIMNLINNLYKEIFDR